MKHTSRYERVSVDHIYRPRRLPSTLGPACLAKHETTGRRFCYGFNCGCIDAHFAAATEAFAEVL